MKWKIVALLAALLTLPAMAADYKTIDWDVLIPEGEKLLPPPQVSHDGNLASVPQPVGGVNKKLDNQDVRIPGFVVPLEGDAKKITAFLLVPYFGACIHVPPPPSNQIVHVTSEVGVKLDELYQPYWIEGDMQVKPSTSELADAGYQMAAQKIYVYELPE